MLEAETGCVLFACSGVEPREGQRLVVIGSSSELGGWDASRGVTLHRVKNPAFAGVWMSFPMLHSARSQVRFQFALVGPGADTVGAGSSACGGMALVDGAVLVDGCQNSSAVTSALSLSAHTDGRSQDCCGGVWEPLGCGLREVEVIGGGFALFGGRWGDGQTQVTALRLEDMVLAQQQLEQDTFPSVSSEMDGEGDRQAERGEMSERGGFGGPPEGGLSVRESDTSLSAPALVLSSPSLTCVSSGKEVGGGHERGHEVRSESVLTHRIADGRQSEGGGRVSLRESGKATVGGVGVTLASKNILVASAQSESLYVSTGQCVSVNEVMGEKKGHDHFDDERCRFAPVCVDGERRVGVLRGRSALTCGGASLLGVHQSRSDKASSEAQWDSSVCEGPKRRRLSSPSCCAVSESHKDWTGGDKPSDPEGTEGRLMGGRRASPTRSSSIRWVDSVTVAVGEERSTEQGRRERAQERSRETDTEGSSVRMADSRAYAKTVEGRASVGTVVDALLARNAEGRASVSTVVDALLARNAEGRASVNMGGSVTIARIVEGRVFVSTADSEKSARIAEGPVYVSTVVFALSARIVEGRASVSTVANVLGAKSAGGGASASTVVFALTARSVEGGASVSTVVDALIARSAAGRAFVSTGVIAISGGSAAGRKSVNTAGSVPNALSSAVLAVVALSAVLADTRPSTLLPLGTLPAVSTDALASTLFALRALSTMLTEALTSTLLALSPFPTVLTNSLPTAVLAVVALPAVLTDAIPSTNLALWPLPAVLADALPSTIH
eukprot:Cvel_25663.t1-p1 / transcript=Cvel_25663.t1 / gene=Cvel_25663 / organism=Chromera_velia_CCMP2878 / gene_product=Zinc finger protein 571, putative / transcript_product=Zinc finger protein 571, putative / location=Cvel_scaffold2940:1-6866(-) / protein_length=785 / sequence_SO=supercontig / SO=protein_coding / is_pseudo=false